MDLKEKFMLQAIAEADKGIAAGHGGPFGAVIVKGGQVIAAAYNTVLRDNDPTMHAEIRAISKASGELNSFKLSECVLYSTTEPCPMCFSAIHWAGIDTVVFGTSIEDVKRLGFNELTISAERMKAEGASPVNIVRDFMREECSALLERWTALPEHKVY